MANTVGINDETMGLLKHVGADGLHALIQGSAYTSVYTTSNFLPT